MSLTPIGHTPSPVYDKDGVVLFNGDALRVLPHIPSDSVGALLTDPPYSSGGAFRGDRQGSVADKYMELDYLDFDGDTRDSMAYQAWCMQWLAECWRIVIRGGFAMVFTDWRQLPNTMTAMGAAGFVVRGLVPWDKTGRARPMSGRFANQCEYVVWGSKGTLGNDYSLPCHPGIVTAHAPTAREHPSQKPEGVIEFLLGPVKSLAVPTIIDPFAGSGTALRVAKSNGMGGIGIELSSYWAEKAAADLDSMQLGLFDSGKKTEADNAQMPLDVAP